MRQRAADCRVSGERVEVRGGSKHRRHPGLPLTLTLSPARGERGPYYAPAFVLAFTFASALASSFTAYVCSGAGKLRLRTSFA